MSTFPRRRLLVASGAVAVTVPAAFAAGTLLTPDQPQWRTPTLTAATSPASVAAVARASRTSGVQRLSARDLRVASYDPARGRAKLTAAPAPAPASASASTATSTATSAPGGKTAAVKPPAAKPPAVKAGDVIASATTPQLPHGALIKVVDPTPDRTGAVAVQPATLPDLLGDATVNATAPVSPDGLTVKPLRTGVSAAVSAARPAATPAPSASGSPTVAPPASAPASDSPAAEPGRVLPAADLIAPAPLPAGAADGRYPVGGQIALDLDVPLTDLGFTGTSQDGPTLAGWVRFQPQVILKYQRNHADGAAPSRAAIGIGGTYDEGFKVHAAFAGKVDTGRQPLRLPFAEVHVHTTVFVLGFPIVVDADLTYFYQVTVTGQVSVDAEQKTTGEVSLGAEYRDGGWTRLPVATAATTPGRHLTLSGSADATATIGAQLTVALYGTAGATLEWAPFLRATIGAVIPSVNWAVYAGYDLRPSLFVQLKIFGIPIIDKKQDLPALHGEWRLSAGVLRPSR